MQVTAASLVLMLILSSCGSDNGDNGPDVAAWLGLAVGNTWSYQVDETLEGEVTVVKIDPEFADGIDAFKVEFRIGGFVQVTRWYQVVDGGLFLLGEEAQEGGSVVTRTYQTPMQVIPHPLELPSGQLKATWNTESAMEEGGTEAHRYDNLGLETLDLPAGNLDAYHLVLNRTDTEGFSHQYNLYFTPENWMPQFDYPVATNWQLR